MSSRAALGVKWLAALASLALVQVGAAMTWSVLATSPAAAQIRDDRYPFLERRQRWWPSQRFDPLGLFPRFGPSFEPRYRPREPRERSQAVDSSKAPAPRKTEAKPTTTILVLGDSMADWLAYGLEEAFADNPDVGVVRKIRTISGLIQADQRAEDWLQTAREHLAAERPDYVVVMLGLSDRQSIRERVPARSAKTSEQGEAEPGRSEPAESEPGQAAQAQTEPDQSEAGQADAERGQPGDGQPSEAKRNEPRKPAGPAADGKATTLTREFRSDRWAELYMKRIDGALAVLRSRAVPVLWVGLPVIRGTRSKSEVSYLNDLYRSRVEKAGAIYVDVWDGFIDEDGNFMTHGPDYDGQTRRLRTGDGVHFTKAGAVKLARYVEREIKRLMLARTTPLALPEPQAPGQPGGPAARAVIGPVLPLNRAAPASAGELAGAGPVAGAVTDPVANRVLVRGEPAPARSGRADDFSWPRPGVAADANEVTPFEPARTGAAPPGAGAAKKTATPQKAGTQKRVGPAAPAPAQKQRARQVQ